MHEAHPLSAKAGHWGQSPGKAEDGRWANGPERVSQETYKAALLCIWAGLCGYAKKDAARNCRVIFFIAFIKESIYMKKKFLPIVGLALAAALLFGLWYTTKPKVRTGSKALTVEVIHGNGESRAFDFRTDAQTLADALVEQAIVEDNQGAYGLYILTADSETVNEANQEWWCITKGGESLMTGASETVIADGEHYELTFTVGYDF